MTPAVAAERSARGDAYVIIGMNPTDWTALGVMLSDLARYTRQQEAVVEYYRGKPER